MIYFAMKNVAQYRVEVCMTYHGKTSCRTVSGGTEEATLRGAIDNACADISAGVTETLECTRSTPTSVKWLSKK